MCRLKTGNTAFFAGEFGDWTIGVFGPLFVAKASGVQSGFRGCSSLWWADERHAYAQLLLQTGLVQQFFDHIPEVVDLFFDCLPPANVSDTVSRIVAKFSEGLNVFA